MKIISLVNGHWVEISWENLFLLVIPISNTAKCDEIFITAKCEYEDALKKMGSKLILNAEKIKDKNQKNDLEKLFGSTQHSTKQYPQILQKLFFYRSIKIFQSLID